MKKLVSMLTSVCLLLVVALAVSAPMPAEAANDEVQFKVTSVELEKDNVILKGKFVNDSDVYQRVLGMKLKYVIRNEDGEPILMNSYINDHMKVDVGADPVPYTIRVEDRDATYTIPSDISGWKIDCDLTLE